MRVPTPVYTRENPARSSGGASSSTTVRIPTGRREDVRRSLPREAGPAVLGDGGSFPEAGRSKCREAGSDFCDQSRPSPLWTKIKMSSSLLREGEELNSEIANQVAPSMKTRSHRKFTETSVTQV